MSDLNELMAEGMADLLEVAGAKSFTIAGVSGVGGVPATFTGDLDAFAVESEKLRPQGGGYLTDTKAVIVAAVAQFALVANPEKTLPLKVLSVGARTWRIAAAEVDDVFITLQLENPSK